MTPSMTLSPLAPASKPSLHPVPGVNLATAASGVKYKSRDDLLLMVFDQPAAVAGVLTRSQTASAPVDWCRKVLGGGQAAAILVNAGNANAFTGAAGVAAARRCAEAVSKALAQPADMVLLASTGVIGETLPDERITPHIDRLTQSAGQSADHWHASAEAIRTTDTFAKAASAKTSIGNTPVTITGIAKGSGMIAPDMATMLGFIATDADLSPALLKTLLPELVNDSFNSITVDGDTSTSDTVILAATGQARHQPVTTADDPVLEPFIKALRALMIDLACQIVRDGEGASKFVTVTVTGAETDAAARRVALAIGNSPLVKTAIAGEDANWGRIVMAVGKSGEKVNRDRLDIAIGNVPVTRNGARHENYAEDDVNRHMKGQNIALDVNLNIGAGKARIWTCDLTQQYIIINADYRS